MKTRVLVYLVTTLALIWAFFLTANPIAVHSKPPLQSTPTPQPDIKPVTANKDWKPVFQRFDDVEMALVPPGCFQMGLDEGGIGESPIHQVCFEQPFWIDRYEVTNEQFRRLGGKAENPSKFPGDQRPREQITWFEAQDFCAKRGSRLPTEAEWEYTARGPDNLIYPWGNTLVEDNLAWFGNTGGESANVGSWPSGASWVGAMDLSGNVWEWVADWYDEQYYASSPKINPQGPSSGQGRVRRGGSWYYYLDWLRSVHRDWVAPGNIDSSHGFRCARSLK